MKYILKKKYIRCMRTLTAGAIAFSLIPQIATASETIDTLSESIELMGDFYNQYEDEIGTTV